MREEKKKEKMRSFNYLGGSGKKEKEETSNF